MELLHKVSSLLLESESNIPFFVPKVVSIGPYHHGDERLAAMESFKIQSLNMFDDEARERVYGMAESVRNRYDIDPSDEMDPNEFAMMLFLDACFIVHFISRDHQGYVVQDLFLLENQLPYEVLKAVMPDPSFDEVLARFICSVSRNKEMERAKVVVREAAGEDSSSPDEHRIDMTSRHHPEHLLDMLHQMLISPETKGTVSLPQLIIDDTTKSKFLNLMAVEMCPKGKRGYGVTSYICLLDNLIDHADDVRELRFRGVLVNCLGSDQQAADLFNELATNRTPYPDAYGDIMTGIHKHLNNRCKVSLAMGYNKHFNTPWSMIATCAATLGLRLSAVQTWYSVK